MRPPRALLATLALAIAGLAPASVAQAADTLTVDFETGPPIGTAVNDDYLASAFTRFIAADVGFRPFRRSAPGQARSGTIAADVGSDVCFPDTGNSGGCEFVTPNSTGRLTRTASAVTVYAGLFSAANAAVSARLTAYRANGTTAAVSPAVPISTAGFTSKVTVTSAAPDIARFELAAEGLGALSSTLGFDDLTIEFPDSSLPDVSLSAPTEIRTVLQGASIDVPIELTRLNASNGPVDLAVTGLPPGVTATFLPDPVTGTGQTATMRLTAAPDAAPFFQPAELTVTADPLGDANVAPGPRTALTSIVVGTNFDVSAAGAATRVDVPQCAPGDVGLKIQRNLTFGGTVTLTATGLPPGVTAEFVPSATIAPGGNLIAERTLRLRRGVALVPASATVQVRATAPGLPQRTLSLGVANAQPTASVTTGLGVAPRRGLPGTELRLEGNGFCAGTRVQVGNRLAEADTQIGADERSLVFRVPRTATTGPVTVVPPGGASYATANSLTVRTFRTAEGFAFDNYPYEYLSFGELTDLVGIGDMFVEVNVCWPLGNCPIPTGVPDPVAFLTWGVLNVALRQSGGHCFGISRTVQELLAKKVRYLQFASGAELPFELPSASGPNAALGTWLDARHAGQGTAEFLYAYLRRSESLSVQLDKVRSELAAGRYPGISLKQGLTKGHVVTAYDVEDQPDGSVKVYLYDNARPFTAAELTDPDRHRSAEVEQSVIRILPGGTRWEFGTWSGDGGDWFTVPLSVIPDDPSLPGLNALTSITVFGSAGAAASVADIPKGAEYLPAQDDAAVPGAAGFTVAPGSMKRLVQKVEGNRRGTYSQAITGAGFAGVVRDMATGDGVSDVLTAEPRDGRLEFSGERERALHLDLAVRDGQVRRGATITTKAFRGGTDSAALGGGGSLRYTHDGAPATLAFELTSASRNGGAARFSSGPLRIGSGERIRATPVDWSTLGRVRLEIVRRNGSRTTRVLSDRASIRTRLALRRPALRSTKTGRRASVRLTIRRPTAIASGGVVLRLVRDGRTVARRAVGLRRPGSGRTVSWRLPKLTAGTYRLLADATLVIGGSKPATLRKRSSARVRLR